MKEIRVSETSWIEKKKKPNRVTEASGIRFHQAKKWPSSVFPLNIHIYFPIKYIKTCTAAILSPSCGSEINDTNTVDALITSQKRTFLSLLQPVSHSEAYSVTAAVPNTSNRCW